MFKHGLGKDNEHKCIEALIYIQIPPSPTDSKNGQYTILSLMSYSNYQPLVSL